MNKTLTDRVDLQHPEGGRWQRAFRALVMPAVRVHHYRNLHTAMMRDAMYFLEKCAPDERTPNE